MEVIELGEDKKLAKEFIRFPVRLYRGDEHWIRPIDKEIEEVFHKETNKFFRHGECTRFLLQDAGKTIGRVAVFVDKKEANKNDQPTGGMGFFECIDDQKAANMLFDTCKKWLEERGMEAMDGPINFGNRDKWWGLLVDGYQYPPNYGMFWHKPYYKKLFENYGFKEYYQQYTFQRGTIAEGMPESAQLKADRIKRNPKYHFEHLTKKHIDKYTEDFRTVYNKAWVKHKVGEMPKAQAKLLMSKMKPVLDERIIWFAYYENEPVGFFIMLPELNQIFRHLNGKLDLIGKLKFLYYKMTNHVTTLFGVAFGIVPEHQGKGLEGAISQAAYDLGAKDKTWRYTSFEMNWIGDFNTQMIHLAEQMGASVLKTHATFRYLFDREKEFKRHPKIN